MRRFLLVLAVVAGLCLAVAGLRPATPPRVSQAPGRGSQSAMPAPAAAFRQTGQAHEVAVGRWSARVDDAGLRLAGESRAGEVVFGHARVNGAAPRALARREHPGEIAYDFGTHQEAYRPMAGALEVRWRFEGRPAGTTIDVQVPVFNVADGSVDAAGVHLATAGGKKVRFGHGTWIDADGQRTPVPARWSAGALALTVDAQTVKHSRFPAVLDPVISPEEPATVDDVVSAGANNPALATDGTHVLAVWTAPPSSIGTTVLAPDGSVVVPGTAYEAGPVQTVPRVAFDGTDYLVVWGLQGQGVMAWRFDMAGKPVEAAPVNLAPGYITSVAVAESSTGVLVAWTSDGGVYGQRIGPGLSKLDPNTLGFGMGSGCSGVSVAQSGGQFLVAWDRQSTARAEYVRVASTGALLDAQPVALTVAGEGGPSVAGDAAGYGIGWLGRDLGRSVIRFSRMDRAGTLLDPAGIVVTDDFRAMQTFSYAGASLVAFDDFHTIRAVRYGPTSARIDTLPVSLGSGTTPMAAVLGDTLLMALVGYDTWGNFGAFARRFDPGLAQQGAEVLLYAKQPTQQKPSLACNASLCLVGFQQGAARVDLQGKTLDPAGLPIAPDMVATDGTDFFAVWTTQYSELMAARVGADGTVDPPGGRELVHDGRATALVGTSGHYVLSWIDNGTYPGKARAARLDAQGRFIDGTPKALPNNYPVVATDGVGFLALGTTSVFLLDADLQKKFPSDIVLPSNLGLARDAIFDGSHYLIATDQGFLRLAPDGTLTSSQATVLGTPVFDGRLTWGFGVTPGGILTAVRVDTAGRLLDSSRRTIATSVRWPGPPAGSSGAAGTLLVAYVRDEPATGFGRVQLRAISDDPGPTGTWCADGSDCRSGRCVDRVCCDGTCGGGDPTDCMACSVEAGAAEDGVCGPVKVGTVCRAAAGTCDLAEVCNGGTACPPDVRKGAGEPCFGGSSGPSAIDPCRTSDLCDGLTNGCQGQQNVPNGTPCVYDACSVDGHCKDGGCDGTSSPPMPEAGPCLNPMCDAQFGGVFVMTWSDGDACSDGNPCHGPGTCKHGWCDAPRLSTCSDGCAGAPDGTTCDDFDACTVDDHCLAGVCTGTPKTCPAPSECEVGVVCNPATGQCQPYIEDWMADRSCASRGLCARSWYCLGIACVPAWPTKCTAGPCRANARCEEATGACVDDPAPDGTSCDDKDPCTVGDRCLAGQCVGTKSTCQAVDECHQGGQCDSATGACTSTRAPDGTTCSEADTCRVGSQCLSGSCGAAKVCPAPTAECRLAGSCDPADGQCHESAAPEGWPCDDADPCTVVDVCASGSCQGSPKTCAPLDACHLAGSCDPASGKCGQGPAVTDGTACDDGDFCTVGDTCKAGVCIGGAPYTCPAPYNKTCEEAVCRNGQCGTQTAPDGTACDDGSKCTTGETCKWGLCGQGTPVVCPPASSCRVSVCDPSKGCTTVMADDYTDCEPTVEDACALSYHCKNGWCEPTRRSCEFKWCRKYPTCDAVTGECDDSQFEPDGDSCDDKNPCTEKDTCKSGECVPGTPRVCDPPAEGFAEGVCDPKTGKCTYPPLPPRDAGTADAAGPVADSGAGQADAAGQGADAAAQDAGAAQPADAGFEVGPQSGCGCGGSGGPSPLLAVAMALLLLVPRRRPHPPPRRRWI